MGAEELSLRQRLAAAENRAADLERLMNEGVNSRTQSLQDALGKANIGVARLAASDAAKGARIEELRDRIESLEYAIVDAIKELDSERHPAQGRHPVAVKLSSVYGET